MKFAVRMVRVARGFVKRRKSYLFPFLCHFFPLFPPVLFVRTWVAACFANISLSNLKLSVNCCDDRGPLYTGPAQCGCSVLEGKRLHTKGLSHPTVCKDWELHPVIFLFRKHQSICSVFWPTQGKSVKAQREIPNSFPLSVQKSPKNHYIYNL